MQLLGQRCGLGPAEIPAGPFSVVIDGVSNGTYVAEVAAVQGKQHRNVLALIRKRIAESGEWGLLNFKQPHCIDPQNGKRHTHVHDKIQALMAGLPAEFNQPNFPSVGHWPLLVGV